MIRLGQASRVNDLKNKMSILQQAEMFVRHLSSIFHRFF